MRVMYDSLNPAAIPTDAQMVASYIDGSNAPAAGWEERFPNSIIVQIARLPETNAGHVLDGGDNGVTPQQCVEWVRLRRSAGADPTVYTNQASLAGVKAAFVAAGEAEPHYWRAAWNGSQDLQPDEVAHQYADSRMTGQDYDLSVVADHWPGVDAAPQPAPAPQPTTFSYVVQHGDNMSVVAQRHGMTLPEIEQLNPQAGHPAGDFSMIWPGDVLIVTAATPAPAPLPRGNVYVVQRGDSMWAIAQRHGLTEQELEAANPQAGHPPGNFRLIDPGDELTIP